MNTKVILFGFVLFVLAIFGVMFAPMITASIGAPAPMQTQVAKVAFDTAYAWHGNVKENEDCGGWSLDISASPPEGAHWSASPGESGDWSQGNSVHWEVDFWWDNSDETDHEEGTVSKPSGCEPTSTPTTPPTNTPVPPSPTPTSTNTSVPPTPTFTPTATPTDEPPAPTPTSIVTDTPLPTVTDTPESPTATLTFTPTATPTPTEPPPTEEPQEEVTVARVVARCDEENVVVEVRVNLGTGLANIWRIWPDDATGRITRELLLTDHPLLVGSSNWFPSIRELDGCWVVFVSYLAGEKYAELVRVSTSSAQNGIYRMTYTSDIDEQNPDWSVKDHITFDTDGFIFETNMWGSYTNPLFEGEHAVASPDGGKLVYTVGGFVYIWDGVNHTSTGYEGLPVAWMQDGSGLVGIFEGVLQLLDFESGELVLLGAWDDYAPDPRKVYVADLGEMFDQVWWVMPETEMALTGPVVGESLGAFSAEAVEETNHQPEWWHQAEGRAVYDSTLVDEYLENLAAEPASAETVTVQVPVCPNYEGDSIVDCLVAAGMDSSTEARYKLAAKYGVESYDRSVEKNLELLELLRGS